MWYKLIEQVCEDNWLGINEPVDDVEEHKSTREDDASRLVYALSRHIASMRQTILT